MDLDRGSGHMAGSSRSEKFGPVHNPELANRAGLGCLVAHLQYPRFVGCVNLTKGSLRLVEATDDLQAWSSERATPGQNPQEPLFELCSEMIEWARSNMRSDRNPFWPPLPKDAFAGRSATRDDLEAGRAYFVLEGGRPIDIAIPQYAYGLARETHEPVPCILLQAEEEPRGDKIVAFLDLRTNKTSWAHLDNFRLLGQEVPALHPSQLSSPEYPDLIGVFKNLSAAVSIESDVAAKRAYLKNNQEMLNGLLNDGIRNCTPLEAFTLLDGVKSLVSRDLFLKKRAVAMGLPEPGIMMHAIDSVQVCSLLEDDPEVCVFSLYQSPDAEFYGLLLFVDAKEVKADLFPISTGSDGRNTARQIRELGRLRMWEDPQQTGSLLFPLLGLFGDSLIPRLQELSGPRKLMIVPHRWTHILPLHMMTSRTGGAMVSLDDVVTCTTFSSSLTSFQWNSKSHLTVPPEQARTALLCVDVRNLGPGAQFELMAYKNMLANVHGVDIVTEASDIPRDLSAYPILVWSSHGVSDPINWTRNRLIFQSDVFSAERIIGEWDLRTAYIAILAACETGIDLSLDESLDEYLGLDMAIQIAGCSTVVSTMWRVEEYAAAYSAVQLLEGAFLGQTCSSHLRIIRQLFKTGNWYRMVELAYQMCKKDILASEEKRNQRLDGIERLLALPRDAFAQPSRWGVFKSFGRW